MSNNNAFISLTDAENLIVETGPDVTYALLGEPGIGKTALIAPLAKRLGMRPIFIDVPSTDISDIGVPMPDHETKTTRLYPNEHWGFHLDEPLLIFLDEFSKGSKPLQTMLHPLLNKVGGHRRLGAIKLHPDSRVVTTGNLTTDGVGDTLAAHTGNRLTRVCIRKPDHEQWSAWAIERGLSPELVSWAYTNPRLFASYVDGPLESTDVVYNPTDAAQRGQPFLSPRSLAESSHVVAAYVDKRINYTQCVAALQGKIGVGAAAALMTHVDLSSQMPSPDEIRAAPTTCTLPTSAAGEIMCLLNALQWIPGKDKAAMDMRADLDSWFKFFSRMSKEAQSMFVHSAGNKQHDNPKSPAYKLREVMFTHETFKKWALENHYLF